MDKININNIFASNNNGNIFQPLNVNNLYNNDEQKDKKINFNIERLIKLREERRKKIMTQYEKVFKMCLNKINSANDLNKTEVIYDVPEVMFGYSDYNLNGCIQYVNDKLQGINLDTIILGKTIYISWLNLEENIKKKHD